MIQNIQKQIKQLQMKALVRELVTDSSLHVEELNEQVQK